MVQNTHNPRQRQEFKPPYPSGAIRFAPAGAGGVAYDDRMRRVWMYCAAILVSLIIVFGAFYMLGTGYRDDFAEDVVVGDMAEPGDEYLEDEELVVIRQPSQDKAPAARPAPVKPVAYRPAVEEDEYLEDEEGYLDDEYAAEEDELEVAASAPVAPVAAKPLEDSARKTRADDAPLDAAARERLALERARLEAEEAARRRAAGPPTPLEAARAEYEENVLINHRYHRVIGSMKYTYFTERDGDAIAGLREMNSYWNAFRNASYAEYYEVDGSLKYGIDYDQYLADETELRFYSDAYRDMFEYQVDQFAIEYEYAGGLGVDLYDDLERELGVFGRPATKLNLMESMSGLVDMAGGAAGVLDKIYARDLRLENTPVDNREGEVISVGTPLASSDSPFRRPAAAYTDAEVEEANELEIIAPGATGPIVRSELGADEDDAEEFLLDEDEEYGEVYEEIGEEEELLLDDSDASYYGDDYYDDAEDEYAVEVE